jgi:DNA mismatch endonuclease, patch repair protein
VTDVFTKAKRSQVMSLIRGKGNKDTELRLIQFFRLHGITGWRRGWPILGKPDFIFPKIKLVIFVDGCFWHGCPKHGTQPKNNAAFWLKKLTSNRVRDHLVTCTLRRQGWRVLRIWEHDLTKQRELDLQRRFKKFLTRKK